MAQGRIAQRKPRYLTPVAALIENAAIGGVGCWIWKGRTENGGYGSVYFAGRKWPAHRLAWVAFGGMLPGQDLVLDHLCRNPACVNPQHLEPVTSGENVRRGESPIAVAGRRVFCVRGHSLSGDNLSIHRRRDYRHPNRIREERKCKECLRIRGAEYRARRARKAGAPSPN